MARFVLSAAVADAVGLLVLPLPQPGGFVNNVSYQTPFSRLEALNTFEKQPVTTRQTLYPDQAYRERKRRISGVTAKATSRYRQARRTRPDLYSRLSLKRYIE